jgi:hypothetical protein
MCNAKNEVSEVFVGRSRKDLDFAVFLIQDSVIFKIIIKEV